MARKSKLKNGASLEEKLTKNYTVVGECWEYNSGNTGDGYRSIWHNGKHHYAHRLSYEFYNNTTIPDGLVVDHLCHNRACINPAHLRVCTTKENVHNAEHGKISVCPIHNIERKEIHKKDGRIYRYCPVCTREKGNAWYAKNKKKQDRPGGIEKPFCDKHNIQKRRVNYGHCKWRCPLCMHEYYESHKYFWKKD